MLYFRGGNNVEKGTYWNLATLKRVRMKGAGMLPGEMNIGYLNTPGVVLTLAVVAVGAVMAGAFPYGIGVVLFVFGMAFIGAVVIGGYASVKVLKSLVSGTTSFDWSPVTAYFAGKGKKSKKEARKDKDG